MPGLLDFGGDQPGGLLGGLFNDPGARIGLSLLAASSPKLRGLGDVINNFDRQQAYQQEAAWMKTVRDRKTKEWGREDAAAERAAQVQAAIPGLFGTTTQGSVSTPSVGGIPFFSQGTNVDRPSMKTGGFNVQEALRLGMTPRQIQEFAELENVGRQEVARTLETTDQTGRPITIQLDKFGNRIGDGMNQWKAPMVVNQGDRQTFFDPATRQTVGSLGINMSQAERDASARGWAGNALARQRLEFDMGGGADVGPGQAGMVRQFGKPPAGYRWKPDGALESIPGGPTDIKAGAEGVKAEQRKQAAEGSASNVLSAVKDAKELVGVNTAGLGSSLAKIPGTDARDLSSKLETIKSNLGFDRLQQMRDMSPTGGALGSMAVQELIALQATVASLDQGQSRAELTKSLNKIEKHYNNWLGVMNGQAPKAPARSGELGSGSMPPPNVSMRWNPATRTLERVN
jgi:hypothetical protein